MPADNRDSVGPIKSVLALQDTVPTESYVRQPCSSRGMHAKANLHQNAMLECLDFHHN